MRSGGQNPALYPRSRSRAGRTSKVCHPRLRRVFYQSARPTVYAGPDVPEPVQRLLLRRPRREQPVRGTLDELGGVFEKALGAWSGVERRREEGSFAQLVRQSTQHRRLCVLRPSHIRHNSLQHRAPEAFHAAAHTG